MKTQLKIVLTLWLLVAMVASQGLINRVRIEDKAEGTGECWLRIDNTEEILDFRTTCPLGNMTHAPKY